MILSKTDIIIFQWHGILEWWSIIYDSTSWLIFDQENVSHFLKPWYCATRHISWNPPQKRFAVLFPTGIKRGKSQNGQPCPILSIFLILMMYWVIGSCPPTCNSHKVFTLFWLKTGPLLLHSLKGGLVKIIHICIYILVSYYQCNCNCIYNTISIFFSGRLLDKFPSKKGRGSWDCFWEDSIGQCHDDPSGFHFIDHWCWCKSNHNLTLYDI